MESFQSVQFSCSVIFDSLQPHGLQHTRPPCPSRAPGACSNSCPLSRWCHQPSHPLSSPPLPAFNLSQHQGLFQWVSSSHQVAKVLEFQLQHQSFQLILRVSEKWVKSLSRVGLFVTQLTVLYQASPSMGFSRQEHWSGLPFPSPNRELGLSKYLFQTCGYKCTVNPISTVCFSP